MTDPLAGLKDIHLPEPVSWWPPAPGWWLLALLVVVLVILAWRLPRARRRALHDEAVRELEAVRARFERDGDLPRLARDLSRLLRRVAISRFPREEVAGLVGQEWLEFLDRAYSGDGFREGPGRILVEAPYRPEPESFDTGELFDLVNRWLESVTRETRRG